MVFYLEVPEVHIVRYEIEADDQKAAIEEVENFVFDGDPDSDVYDHTIMDDWWLLDESGERICKVHS
jgi:tRNA A58 N-methylase Trm61